MTRKHLFVTDLDGTLLGPDSRVSERSAGILSRLSREGVAVTVATARTPATVEPLLAETFTTIPAVVMTGAALWDRNSGRYLDPIFVAAEAAGKVEAAFRQANINPFVYALHSDRDLRVSHHPDMTEKERHFYEERSNLPLKKFVFDYSEIPSGMDRVILFYALGSADKIEPLASRLAHDPALSVSCYRDIFNPAVANIEVFGAGVSKAAAIKRLAGMIGAESITVYGDNLNDLSMFEVADESVAVANAVEQVRRAATRVIGPNGADAVALDIEKIARSSFR